MNLAVNDNDKKNCTYFLDEMTIVKLERLHQHRKQHGRHLSPMSRRKSTIVADAIALLYNYEICGKSIVHPNDKANRIVNARDKKKRDQL